MKKKGFVLMETIIVIVVISVALLTIFASYNKILSKVKTENKYDTSEYIYMTYYVKKYLSKKAETNSNIKAYDFKDDNVTKYSPTNYYTYTYIPSYSTFNIKKIYILKGINSFDIKIPGNTKKNSSYFDAYMIDYIRKLDVRDTTSLIIVEYNRPVRKIDGYEIKKDTRSNDLNETYISSLEW